jgi:hypothetical protein
MKNESRSMSRASLEVRTEAKEDEIKIEVYKVEATRNVNVDIVYLERKRAL